MNTCPHCGRESNSAKPRCANCPADLQPTKKDTNSEHYVIEPEVVQNNSSAYNRSRTQWSNEQGSSGFKMWTFQQYGGVNSRANDSCLPGFITMGIALSLAVQFGLLASIGFLVFYALGSAIGFVINMRRMVQGQKPTTWITRILVWFVCVLLTVALAG